MPSGLLNGKGCYDSVLRGEDESSIYLSIRHHSTPFLIEQRKARALQEMGVNKSQQEIVDGEVKEWLAVGALPFAKKCVQFLFLVLVWPFYFVLYQLPQLAIEKIISPIFDKIKKIVEMIVRPIIKGFLVVYRPVAAVCTKICNLYRSCIAFFQRHLLVILAFVRKCERKVHKHVIAPPQRVLQKCRIKVIIGHQRCVYLYRAFNACCRLLVKHGLDHVRNKKL